MCFCYIDDSCWINWVDEVDIIDEESEIFLRNIPFETVKDFLVNDTNSSLPRLIQRRIRFCDLSEEQRTNIKEFIRMNAV